MIQRERQLEKQETKEIDKEFISYLPSELIVFDILSKLPIRSIAICRCVCKSWLNLVGTREFAKFHLPQSAPGLVLAPHKSNTSFNIFEINDDVADLEQHELHYRLFAEFTLPHAATLRGSVNGLLLFNSWFNHDRCLYICNPITREYIELPEVFGNGACVTYGFGVSKMSGQHKVVGILKPDNSGCVYTLGTGSRRSIAASSAGNPLNYVTGVMYAGAVFVNGNLHWLVRDVNGSCLISCFDLETEAFSTFPSPCHGEIGVHLCVLGNCLCFCEWRSYGVMIIWLAKDEKIWTKEFVVMNGNFFNPIKFSKDGDILIATVMFCYSAKTKTTQKLGIFDQLAGKAIVYTPSFLSLKSFGIENAISF